MKEDNNKVIVIPALPPKEASPNWRGHWAVKYKAMKDYKSLTILMASQQIKGKHVKPLKRATIKTTLVIPDRRFIMDGDNAIASLKAGIDGLVAASILSDDKDIHVMPVTYKIDKRQAPKTIIHVQPITTQA